MAEPSTDGSPSTLSREQGRKIAPLDLSRLVLGYYRDDPDHLGHFEIGQASAAECLQSLGVRVALEHHGCPDFFTILGVRYAEGCRLSDRGMLQEHVVDLGGCDFFSTSIDQFLDAPRQSKLAVVIEDTGEIGRGSGR